MLLRVLFTPLLLGATALAGHNCKCQDDNGQYNSLTEQCCYNQQGLNDITYHPDQHHQCSSSSNAIDSGAFVRCCQGLGVGGAYCWD